MISKWEVNVITKDQKSEVIRRIGVWEHKHQAIDEVLKLCITETKSSSIWVTATVEKSFFVFDIKNQKTYEIKFLG